MDDSKLKEAGFGIDETLGETKIQEYATLHRDISGLKVGNYIQLASIIFEQVWKDEVESYNSEVISQWLLDSMNEKQLKFEDLNKGLRCSIAEKAIKLSRKGKINLEDCDISVQVGIKKQIELNKVANRPRCRFEMECDRYIPSK